MQRQSATVVAVVGEDEAKRAALGALRAATAGAPFVVQDADPLADVATAWVRRYDEQGPAGELEVAVAETLARFRTGSLELPDYYLVVEPEALGVTARHWYLGVLHAAAPARVVPVAAATLAVEAVSGLGAGRWWPPTAELLDGIDRVVPDRVGVMA